MNYFYATQTPDLYDEEVRSTSRYYDLAFSIYVDFILTEVASLNNESISVFDIGCGTGEGLSDLFSSDIDFDYKGFDLSRQMIEILKQKLCNYQNRKDSALIVGDLLSSEELKGFIEGSSHNRKIIISSFVLHHFSPDQKIEVYSQIREHLEPGELFVNLDLYDYENTKVSKFAVGRELGWIDKCFSEKADAVCCESAKAKVLEQKDKWVEHIVSENIPIPISTGLRASQNDTEEQLLFRAGFSSVECIFRVHQTGILIAEK